MVFFHHCAYCTSTAHASEGGVRQEWVPLFEKYTVDLVINGHNHQYERTDVIKGGAVTKKLPIGGTAYPETEGVVYVTAGAAGRSLYAFTAPLSYEGHENEVESVVVLHQHQGRQAERDRHLVARALPRLLVPARGRDARRRRAARPR